MRTVLHQDAWCSVTVEATFGLLRYERSGVPYGSIDDVDRAYAAIAKAIEDVPGGLKLLLDLRRAPPRNDDAFESRTRGALERLVARFPRHATLIRTAAGKLQTARLAAERNMEAHVFDDERAALAYLAGPA